MDHFCADEFWDSNLTWGNHRPYPEFTECFQNTVLQCLGSMWLWIMAPVYMYILLGFKSDPLPRSWLNSLKQSITVLQLSTRLMQLFSVAQVLDSTGGNYWTSWFTGLAVECITMLLVMIFVELERRKRFVTSGILSIYCLLTFISGLCLFYSAVVKKSYDGSSDEMVILKTLIGLAFVQLILCCFPEELPAVEGKQDCSLSRASFFSRCTYCWMNNFMTLGYNRPLESKDFSKLMPSDQSENVVSHFETVWDREVEIQQTNERNKSAGSKIHVSLLTVLLKAFGWNLIGCNTIRLIANVADLVQPVLLGYLIGFAEDSSMPTWKGFAYLAVFLMCLAIEDVTVNYLHHLSNSNASNLGSGLVNAVFKKSMKMTNRARSESTVGEIVNLISTDVEYMKFWMAYVWIVWSTPSYAIACFVILYNSVGVAVFAGIAVLLVIMPFNIFLAKRGHVLHKDITDRKDNRIKLLTEIFNGIKILKLYAWELAFGDRILKMRNSELAVLKKLRLYQMIRAFAFCIAPCLMGLTTLTAYIYLNEDHVLTAQTAFSSLAVLGMLNHSFAALPNIITQFMKAIVSLKRLDKFLNNDDIHPENVTHNASDDAISIKDGTFTWDEKLGATLKGINMSVPKGSLVAVVGRIGAGKSTLLSAILGEIEKDNGQVNTDGSIAYVPQQAWIQNATLQNNILFGEKLNPKTYKAVTDACALVKDLEVLPGKDQTEIGEKGINLSGGQKQRVSMARAVYNNADIYLLDDPLSAVDAHVGKHIFEQVIGNNGLLTNKTRVLVTHGITWLPHADKIFVMDNGAISESGSYEGLLAANGPFAQFIGEYKQEHPFSDDSSESEEEPDSGYNSEDKQEDKRSNKKTNMNTNFCRSISTALSDEFDKETNYLENDIETNGESNESINNTDTEKGKFIDEEEVELGKVQLKYILPYITAVGKISCLLILLCFAAGKFCEVAQSILIKEWTANDDLKNLSLMPSDSDERKEANIYYIAIYSALGAFQGTVLLIHEALLAFAVVRAATKLHERMTENVLRGKMSFFDTTPVGRIVNRFSHDMDPLDGAISGQIEWFLHVSFGLCSVFAIIMYTIPQFVIMVLPVTCLYYYIQRYFVPARRQISRLESKKRSPIFSHFSESLNGTSVIRAYGCQERFAKESAKKVDEYREMQFHNASIDRWMGVRLGLLNIMCFLVTVLFALNERNVISGAVVGLLMNYALRLNGELNGMIRVSGEIERSVVSIERIGQYSSRETEAPLHTSTQPPKEWPDKGVVDIKNLSLRYREDTDLVLKNVNVSIRQGEKIGIVGRTGAGKSSLTLGLFRLIEPAEGSIHIDGLDVSDLGLFDLRSSLTILPQEPVLFSGTLKINLDPMNEHSEEAIYNALEHAHLKSFVESLPDKLEYECGEGGQNLSVGQRQLICLARSLLRKSKVLVLDEATAAVDLKTDELIQNTIKAEFKECTVLTIAHRLNTIIDYDRILVLSHGEVKEFDKPQTLLQDKNSMFYSMAKDAGLVI